MQAVFLDMDGTLLDSIPFWYRARRQLLLELSRDEEQVEKMLAQVLSMSGRASVDYIVQAYGDLVPEEVIRRRERELSRRQYEKDIPLKQGAADLLKALSRRRIPVYLITETQTGWFEPLLQRQKVLDCFSKVISTPDYGYSKDNVEIWRRLARLTGQCPEQTLVVEDSPYAAKAARAAGYSTCGIYEPYRRGEQAELRRVCDVYLTDFSAFPMELFESEQPHLKHTFIT